MTDHTLTLLKPWLKGAGVAIGLCLLFQLVITAGQLLAYQFTYHQARDHVERRVSLDCAYLDIGNQTLNTPVNHSAVARYIDKMNQQLQTMGYPIRLAALQNVGGSLALPETLTARTTVKMQSAEQVLEVSLAIAPWWQVAKFSVASILGALIIAPMLVRLRQTQKARHQLISGADEAEPQPRLVIDLHNKTIGNGVDDTHPLVQNKPFCFYVALVRYCIDHPDSQLLHHKDVPPELINAANSVFSRLIELGHSKRKRPDFNANLDKTLSEIRSVLEEVFSQYSEAKEKYYPPRAQGEGSRSKQHSFALTNLTEQDVEIIGN